MAQLSPYLFFNNHCQEAMTFYQQCLGGDLTIQTVGQSPMAAQMPAETHNSVLHADLRNEHIHVMASDMADPSTTGDGSIRLCLFSEDKEEIKRLFASLSRGGEVTDPLKDEYFGLFGAIKDKFGQRWMFQGGAMAQS